jgi:hypothetical protein
MFLAFFGQEYGFSRRKKLFEAGIGPRPGAFPFLEPGAPPFQNGGELAGRKSSRVPLEDTLHLVSAGAQIP